MAEKKAALKDASAKDAKAKDAALEAAVTQIERDFGAGALMRLGAESRVQIAAIPTGSLALDLALGIGGVPRGRIVEIFGPESSGKTTLIYHIIAEAQARGGVCVFIDTEHSLDPIYARAIGVDTDELLVSQPDYGEQALQIADRLIASTAVDVVAIDSVAALTPKAELDGQIGDQTVGLQARLMSQAMRKLTGNLSRTNTVCLFTNQIREKVGVQFGSPGDPAGRPGAEVLPPRSDSTSAGSRPSKTAPRRSATGSASRSSRTKSRPPSARPSSTSSTARGSPARAG